MAQAHSELRVWLESKPSPGNVCESVKGLHSIPKTVGVCVSCLATSSCINTTNRLCLNLKDGDLSVLIRITF